MGSNLSRVECMWLPAQSGKTRKCEERITEQQNREKEIQELVDLHNTNSSILNIIICSNNRSLVDQTTSRMKTDLFTSSDEDNADEEEMVSDAIIVEKVFGWRSGLLNHNKTVGDLCMDILEGSVEMIICCSHATRLKYVYQLIERLNRSPLFKRKINIWIDEADGSIKLWSKPELNVFGFSKVDKVTLISATFDSIVKRFGRIKVIPFAETHAPVYHRIEDSDIRIENHLAKNAVEYLEETIKSHEEICQPGIRLFAPGDISRKSHNDIAELLQSKGFVVVILNGERKMIIGIPGKGDISLNSYVDFNSTEQEIGKLLSEIYIKEELHQYPYAITGNMCIGRGITFQNENFLFDWGIIPYISDESNAYQTVCRTCGNIRHLPNYAPPKLIMTDKMCKQVMQKEHQAVNVARIVHERYAESNEYDGFIYEEDIKDISNPEERNRMHVPFRIDLSDEEFETIVASSGQNLEQVIRSIIQLKNNHLYETILTYKCIQKTIPESENSYKKHIQDVAKKVDANEKFVMDISKKYKHINSCQFYIDNKNKKIYVIVYSGYS